MPLVGYSELPSFKRLRDSGLEVLDLDRARQQDIRELHVGLLNLMPDAALQATERQFMRLVGSSNPIAQIFVHPLTVPGVDRRGEAKTHVETYYEDFDRLREDGLDALIVTGANPANPDLTKEGFWDGMVEVIDWARENVCSILCSCLATHGVLKQYHGVERVRLAQKRWGVYAHHVTDASHPLVRDINTHFDAPHSHVYDMTREQMEAVGNTVLGVSDEAGVYLAVSEDQFRFVMFQGHPEYDINSLLKEYKREVGRFVRDEREDYPPYPQHYFGPAAVAILEPYRESVEAAKQRAETAPEFPEAMLDPLVANTWTDTGKAMFNNWLGLVYQLTDRDRRKPFMPGVDPADPLGRRR